VGLPLRERSARPIRHGIESLRGRRGEHLNAHRGRLSASANPHRQATDQYKKPAVGMSAV
jgi:hypothetical protein